MKSLVPNEIRTLIPGAVAVGGCVRDMLLGRESNDVDLCTPLHPEDVLSACRTAGLRVIPTGMKHGTVTVMVGGVPYEVTTFRRDVDTDGRHATVEFTGDLKEDLARRDFTINAMALDADGNVYDPFGGREDIERRVIRCVGNPLDRFREDLLRVIRAARFSATLGFDVHPDTRSAMRVVAPELNDEIGERVSIERVVMEMEKAFKESERPSRFLDLLWEIDVFQTIIPEMADAEDLLQDPRFHPEGSVWQHTIDAVDRAAPEHRWNVLFHDIGKCLVATPTDGDHYTFRGHEDAGLKVISEIGDRLNLPRKLIDSIEATTEMHMGPMSLGEGEPSDRTVRRFQHRAGEHLATLEGVVRADTGDRYDPAWDVLWEARQEMMGDVQPVLMGRHLIDRGYSPGPDLGIILGRAFQYQLDSGEVDIDRLIEVATDV